MPCCARVSVSRMSRLVLAVNSSSSLVLLMTGCASLRTYFFVAHPVLASKLAPVTIRIRARFMDSPSSVNPQDGQSLCVHAVRHLLSLQEACHSCKVAALSFELLCFV